MSSRSGVICITSQFRNIDDLNQCLEECRKRDDRSPFYERIDKDFKNPYSIFSLFQLTVDTAHPREDSEALNRLKENTTHFCEGWVLGEEATKAKNSFFNFLNLRLNPESVASPQSLDLEKFENDESVKAAKTKKIYGLFTPERLVASIVPPTSNSDTLKATYQMILSWLNFEARLFQKCEEFIEFYDQLKSFETPMAIFNLRDFSESQLGLYLAYQRIITRLNANQLSDTNSFNPEIAIKLLILYDCFEFELSDFHPGFDLAGTDFCKTIKGKSAQGRFVLKQKDLLELTLFLHIFKSKIEGTSNAEIREFVDSQKKANPLLNPDPLNLAPKLLKKGEPSFWNNLISKATPYLKNFYNAYVELADRDHNKRILAISIWKEAFKAENAAQYRQNLYTYVYNLLSQMSERESLFDLSSSDPNALLRDTLPRIEEFTPSDPLEYLQEMLDKRIEKPKLIECISQPSPKMKKRSSSKISHQPNHLETLDSSLQEGGAQSSSPLKPESDSPEEPLTEVAKVSISETENGESSSSEIASSRRPKTKKVHLSETPTAPPKLFFTYHPRVTRWFTCNLEETCDLKTFPEYENCPNFYTKIIQHGFSPTVDLFWEEHAIRSKWTNGDDLYSLPAQIGSIKGVFTICVNPKTKICYHRYFTEKSENDFLQETVQERFMIADFPPLSRSTPTKDLPIFNGLMNQDPITISSCKIIIYDRRLGLPITLFTLPI